MRFLTIVILGTLVLSATTPGGLFAYTLASTALLAAFVVLRREALVLAPLLLAIPPASAMFIDVWVRLGMLFLLAVLLLLAISDIESRQKGAPLHLSRLLLWYLGGAGALFAALFTVLGDQILPAWPLVLGSILLGAGGVALARQATERARGAKPPAFPLFIDTLVVGFLIAEGVVAIAFLPFSPFTLSALTVVLLWFLVRTTVAHRFDALSMSRLVRFGVLAFLVMLVVTAPVFFA